MTETPTQLPPKLRPLADKVVVLVHETPNKTAGGLFLPDTAKDHKPPIEGTVIAVGPGFRQEDGSYIALDVNEGDHVFYAHYAGTKIRDIPGFENAELNVLKAADIIAVKV